ncbi:hypothetical protein A1E_05195 [Rickettsia canadensis str. McKiel]|uniref:Uncharacterized protein n=1 Tax=Rickettsia canadensis (strain McKiel) TaxID=293613 RepID=A8F022_RICCK|nr:hypothetical protein A1E_05195 [Rickettsia canadensis str. McKiel]
MAQHQLRRGSGGLSYGGHTGSNGSITNVGSKAHTVIMAILLQQVKWILADVVDDKIICYVYK